MSFDLILPFFPEELRALLLDPSISDLMINGSTGVFADRNEWSSTLSCKRRIRTSGCRPR